MKTVLIQSKLVFFISIILLVAGCGRLKVIPPSPVQNTVGGSPEATPDSSPNVPKNDAKNSPENPQKNSPGKKTNFDQDFDVSLAPDTSGQPIEKMDESENYSELVPEVNLKTLPMDKKSGAPAPGKTPPSGSPGTTPGVPKAGGAPAKPEDPKGKQPSIVPDSTNNGKSAPIPEAGKGRRQAINFVNAGKLENPSNLLERQNGYKQNPPFVVVFPSRSRFYGTAEMIEIIDTLGQFVQSLAGHLRLLVSDISQAKGGALYQWDDKSNYFKKAANGTLTLSHYSHQNGLDADIAYLANSVDTKPFADVRKAGDIKTVFNLEAQYKLFKQAVSTEMVDVFFVHPLIITEMCRQALKEGSLGTDQDDKLTVETLRRLIAEPSFHYNHFHMRLKCDRKRQSACFSTPDLTPKTHSCVFTKKSETPK